MGMIKNKIINGDCIEVLKGIEDSSVNCCVTSPPYWGLRDYGVDGQIGLEQTFDEYVAKMVEVFREVRRVLRDDGTLWLNLGDSYAASQSNNGGCSPKSTLGGGGGKYREGSKNEAAYHATKPRKLNHGLKPKDLIGIPWRVAFALQADGWYLRSDIIWHKPNPMPESVTDRPTKAHEYIFLLSKSQKYYYNHEAIKEIAINGDPTSPRGSKGVVGNKNARLRKQDELGKRIYTGFNERYEPLEKRNKRTVWTIPTQPFSEAHFATFPKDLIRPCIRAGCPANGIVIDPFMGSGTTACVCIEENRNYLGIELNHKYIKIAENRIRSTERAGVIDFGEGK